MATTDGGVEYPTPLDASDWVADMQAMAESLTPRIVIPVANVTERNALAATVSPTSSSPLIVFRADADPGKQIEYTADGSTWSPGAQDSGWVNLTGIGANFTQIETLRARQIRDTVHLVGVLQNTTDSGSYVIAGTLGAGIAKPPTDWAVSIATGSSATTRVGYVDTSGNLRVYSSAPSAAYLRVSGTWPKS